MERRLAAIVCADVAGHSRMMGVDEAGTHAAFKAYRSAIHPVILNHGGRIVKNTGDGFLLEFIVRRDAGVDEQIGDDGNDCRAEIHEEGRQSGKRLKDHFSVAESLAVRLHDPSVGARDKRVPSPNKNPPLNAHQKD
jgi:class 3 adenylate cyclase